MGVVGEGERRWVGSSQGAGASICEELRTDPLKDKRRSPVQ